MLYSIHHFSESFVCDRLQLKRWGSGNKTDRKSASRRGQCGGNRRGLGRCTDLAANIDGFLIPLVDYWNGAQGQRSTASCEWPFYEKTYKIPLSNKVEEMSDVNTYHDPHVQFDFRYLDFSLLYVQTLHVFLKDTDIQVLRRISTERFFQTPW